MMKEILDFLDAHPNLPIDEAISRYFEGIIWSLEKEEFERMSEDEREAFYKALRRSTRRCS